MTVTNQYDTKEEDWLSEMQDQIRYIESYTDSTSTEDLKRIRLENLKEIDSEYVIYWQDILDWVDALQRNGQHTIDVYKSNNEKIVFFGNLRFYNDFRIVFENANGDEECVAIVRSYQRMYEVIRGLLG